MKDYKAECDVLRGEVKELKRQLDYYHQKEDQQRYAAEETRKKFKELLLEVLADK